jgi:hypothetical protein
MAQATRGQASYHNVIARYLAYLNLGSAEKLSISSLLPLAGSVHGFGKLREK